EVGLADIFMLISDLSILHMRYGKINNMEIHIYLFHEKSNSRSFLCAVNMPSVPDGIFVIDGVSYKMVEKPTFVIKSNDRGGFNTLEYVDLLVDFHI
ncbi:MAG TPA: hypothetical protein VGK47_01330, partial [Nitrososphaeraceae archaeon]